MIKTFISFVAGALVGGLLALLATGYLYSNVGANAFGSDVSIYSIFLTMLTPIAITSLTFGLLFAVISLIPWSKFLPEVESPSLAAERRNIRMAADSQAAWREFKKKHGIDQEPRY